MNEVFSFSGFLLLFLGTLSGILVGAVPGLTGAMLIALTLPFTFQLGGAAALVLLVSMYVGAVSGGLISATILRIPGTPAAMITTLDGYPMAQQGHGTRALALGVGASLVGGLVSFGFLVMLSAPLADWSTALGPFEYFGLVVMALVLLSAVGGSDRLAGLFSGVLGMAMSMPGMSPATGEVRGTLGFSELADGFKLLPVLIGLFAVNGVIKGLLAEQKSVASVPLPKRGLGLRWRDGGRHGWNALRSSVIGTWIGVLPGVGANIGSALAYGVAKRFSSNPERFGQGSEEGVVASEAANNATVGGALIPLIALGIPGSVIDAILLGALVIHGLQPGPLLFENHPDVVQTVIATYFCSNILMFICMWGMASRLARLGQVPRWLLLPLIMTFCVVGVYALGNRMFDVWVMIVFGGLGWLLDRWSIPLAPFVIGFVLAPLAEESLSAGLMASGGSWWPLLSRPISLALLFLSGLFLLGPTLLRSSWLKRWVGS